MSMLRKQAWVLPANHATPVSSGAEHIRQRAVARQCCSAGVASPGAMPTPSAQAMIGVRNVALQPALRCTPTTDSIVMTCIVFAVLLLLAFAANSRGRRGLARSLAALVIVLFFVVGSGLLPQWLLRHLQRPYVATAPGDWVAHNAIVLLTAGSVRVADSDTLEPQWVGYGRIVEAATLYRQCKATGQDCKLLVSGGRSQHYRVAEAVVYGGVLRRLGVDAADLLLEPNSMNTWQNAQFSQPLLKALGAQHILLVTSGTHLPRASLYFAHFGIAAIPVRADYLAPQMTWVPQTYNFAVTDIAAHEYLGMALYYVYNAMGWNVAATQPVAP
jgi:uncharacterized SAM-binding protein YcdF (DUF218 family)